MLLGKYVPYMIRLCSPLLSAAMLLFAATLSVSCQKEDIPIYSPEDMEREELIKNYLATSYSSAITDVSVTEDKVRISGKYSGTGEFYVAEIPPYMDRLRLEEALTLFEPDGSSFSFETGRMVETENGIVYDRLLSKWAIFEKNGEGSRLVSAARYADEVHAVSSPDAVPLRNKKGGGRHIHERPHKRFRRTRPRQRDPESLCYAVCISFAGSGQNTA